MARDPSTLGPMRRDRIAAIHAEIAEMLSEPTLGAPTTTDTFETDTISPIERYAADAPERVQASGDEFVLFGYDDSKPGYPETRAVLRDVLETGEVEGEQVTFRSHDHHPPAFTYEPAVPVFQSPLRRARSGDRAGDISHACCWVCMRPRDYLRIQASMRGRDVETFVEIRVNERSRGRENITQLERGLRAAEPVVPPVVLEVDTDGNNIYQEGRTRAFIADDLDISWMNVLVAVNKDR